MKNVLIVVLVLFVSGCTAIGQRIRTETCSRSEFSREMAKLSMEKRYGVTVDVDCDFKPGDTSP